MLTGGRVIGRLYPFQTITEGRLLIGRNNGLFEVVPLICPKGHMLGIVQSSMAGSPPLSAFLRDCLSWRTGSSKAMVYSHTAYVQLLTVVGVANP